MARLCKALLGITLIGIELLANTTNKSQQTVGRTFAKAIVAIADSSAGLVRDPFAELHPPLIEGVDLPDNRLHEHLVLVKRHQLPQREGSQRLHQQRAGGLITRIALIITAQTRLLLGRQRLIPEHQHP